MKRISRIALILILAFSLVGCTSSSASKPTASVNTKTSEEKNNNEENGIRLNGDDVKVDSDNVTEYLGLSNAIVVDMSNIHAETIEDWNEFRNIQERQYKEIYDAFLQCPDQIVLWNYFATDNIYDEKFMYDIFWINGLSRSTPYLKESFATVLYPTYSETDKDTIIAMQSEIDAAADSIIEKCNGNEDIWGNCKIIHDELARKNTYDHTFEIPHIYDLYGGLVTGNAVCQGYAYAFSYVTGKLGYEVETVVSADHAWNWLMDSFGYDGIIDVTWDDMDIQDSEGNDYIRYDFFGVTKDEVQKVDSHTIIGINANLTVHDVGHESFNYHKMLGYVIDTYSYSEVVRIFSMQDTANGKLATVKFLNDQAWNDAQELLADDGQLLVNAFAEAQNFDGYMYYWVDEELKVLNVAIY